MAANTNDTMRDTGWDPKGEPPLSLWSAALLGFSAVATLFALAA